MTKPLPWQPLQTQCRSGEPEVTVYGIISVSFGDQNWVYGDSNCILWSRSLLKPWQWLSYAPELLSLGLSREALALITASHQGEQPHKAVLNQLDHTLSEHGMTITCPSMPPLYDMTQANSPWNHPCAGKHSGFLLTAHALGMDTTECLSPKHPLYQRLVTLLSTWLPQWRGQQTITVDGCGMPNWGFHPGELSELYRLLAQPTADNALETLQRIMQERPELVGGTGRLDTALMKDPLSIETTGETVSCWAKEGADGLLGLGLAPSTAYPNGLGILIKLAGGYTPEQFKPILAQMFLAFGFQHSAVPSVASTSDIHSQDTPFMAELQSHIKQKASAL